MLPTLKQAAGASNVALIAPETGSEDFSFFANEVPGLYFYLGGMPHGTDPKDAAPHHTPEFYLDESGFNTGVYALVQLVLDYMEDPGIK
jgi:amidohydrolase